MSDTYVYEPDAGTRIDVAARAALLAGDPGDTLEFVFNDTRVTYVVPDEDADLKDHVKALLTLYDAERTRADREAPPRLGDIVTHMHAAGEWLVARDVPDLDGDLYLIALGPTDSGCYASRDSLRVVRRASYRTVGE